MTRHLDTLARLRARNVEAGHFVLPLNRVWADKAQAAYDALHRAETVLHDPHDPQSAKRIADAQAEVDRIIAEAGDEVAVFKFRRMGRAEYDALVTQYPPTEAQKAEDAAAGGTRRVFNYETFGPVLLQKVLIDPKLPPDEILELVNGPGPDDEGTPILSKAEAEMLLNEAMMAALRPPRALPRELVLP